MKAAFSWTAGFWLAVLAWSAAVVPRPAVASEVSSAVAPWIERHQKEILLELFDALSFRAVAAESEAVRRKAQWLRARFEERGFKAELLETSGNPLVYADLEVQGATRTLLLYMHYDGQPVDPSQWRQSDPFAPVLRAGRLEDGARQLDLAAQVGFEKDWRVYGRSASDDTGPIVALLAAVDALASAGLGPTSNIRVILDGEEEAGSPNLVAAIERYGERLQADLMVIFDGPLHESDLPTVVHGARGILTLELTVYGPKVPVHSGHYGNWVPNPALRLARLLASMKDDAGRVEIAGFYDEVVLSDGDREVLAGVPDDAEGLRRRLGFRSPDEVGATLQAAIQFPSLNVTGLRSGWVGKEARTIVPDQAVAAIDVRLVKETAADSQFGKILAHIRKQGFEVVERDPTDSERATHDQIVKVVRGSGSNAYRTPLDDPGALSVFRALRDLGIGEPVRKRTSGGTVPIAPFIERLGFAAVGVPTVNSDNNQHSPNENLRIGHLYRGILTIAAILRMEDDASP
jgi:acetylornithine deacetylase/succinyl-diaminopimelate desuccinylase-like protein